MTDAAADKKRLRAALLAARRARPAPQIEAARAAVAAHVLQRRAQEGWTCVAAYEPLRTEPGSVALLDGLAAAGVRVLVPVLLADRDLSWTAWGSAANLGVSAVGSADAVLVPALAVDPAGRRLGRGGGSYDRALARARPDAVVAALLFDDELLPAVPVEAWDRPVGAVVRPAGWTRVDGE